MKKLVSVMLCMLIALSLMVTAAAEENEAIYTNTGDAAQDIAGIAATQIGYESSKNGSKYDNVTSNQTDNWSASFVAWCAKEAGVAEDAIMRTSSVTDLFDFFVNNKRMHNSSYRPVCGDIIFIRNGKEINLCGIVTSCDEKYVTAIMGDDNNSVKKKMYDLTLSKIAGYATPDYELRAIAEIGNYITTADYLNFRSQPTTSSEILAKIPMGTIVDITSVENGWGQITYNGMDGYISMDYAEEYDTRHKNYILYGENWNVIDISKFQGTIDWNALSQQDIDVIILRIGFRGTATKVLYTDEKFFEFYQKAKEYGFHVGCYFYSGATTVSEAREEADYVIDIIRSNDLTFDMPVYWDVEDTVIKETGSENICAMTEEFLSVMDEENLYSGVYTSSNWMFDFFNPAIFSGHALWIADWRGYCGYQGDFGMWQYSDTGEIEGIDGYTDMNYCYINYPRLIEELGYNKKADTETPREKGDINGDGKITAADARSALRAAAGLSELDETERYAADYNSDNKVTAADARLILRKAANLT